MPLAPLTSAPRILRAPVTTGSGARVLTGTCDAVNRLRVSPFEPGQSVQALSAGAGQIFGAPAPWGDSARHLKFKISNTDIAVANGVVSQIAVTGGRATSGKVTSDLTVTMGKSTGRLAFGALPAAAGGALDAAEMLGAILLVNGVPYTRIYDANSPAPAALEWALDANTDAGYTLVIGADSTNYLPVGADVDVLIPDSSLIALLLKPGNVAGAALVAGVPEERKLAVGKTVTDTAGRSTTAAVRVEFLAADAAGVTLTGLSK